MSILTKKIEFGRNFSSTSRLGFKHFLLSVAYMALTLFVSVLLILFGAFFLANIFGFYFSSTLQDLASIITITVIGTGTASWVTSKKVQKLKLNPTRVLLASLKWYVGLNLILWYFQYAGDQTPHYGVTPREELFSTTILLSVVSVLAYILVTHLIFKRIKKTSFSSPNDVNN